jgi:RNA polymerase sigma-70 factor (ECF subfamily)
MATDLQNDTALWQLVQQDDRAAYQVLYLRYMELVFAEIQKRIRHQTDAEDLTQDIFLTLWEKRYSIVLEGRFFSYLYRTAQNRVMNYFRDKKIPVDHLEAWVQLSDSTDAFAEQSVAFQQTDLVHLERLVETAHQQLPLKMRQVYELRYEQHLTAAEISAQLVISPNTVRNHLKAVRKRFTLVLKKATLFFLLP